MGAGGYFALAALVLVLMPAVVTSMEGRKAPDVLYPVIAGAGLLSSGLRGGWSALGWSAAAALLVLVVIGVVITLLRTSLRLRILTGGQIKLMAAGATWLGPLGALAMILVATFALFAFAALQQARNMQRRPDSAIIVALAIMCVALQQQFIVV